MRTPNFTKNSDGLLPTIIQDAATGQVLMLGYMSATSFQQTLETKIVTFYSRKKQRLWVKGEESSNFLKLIDLKVDCDGDALLLKVSPTGPVCHLGTHTCWGEELTECPGFLTKLQAIIAERKGGSIDDSYTSRLFKEGLNRIIQKVGEEATEVIIAAKDQNHILFLEECADMMYHFLVLLEAKNVQLKEVEKTLIQRHFSSK